jgi:radical SAM superfamily enzyme YgiQ (UPF0313 family)
VVFGRRPRIKTAPQNIAELEDLLKLGRRSVFIDDDNIIGNKKAIKTILREIIAWQQARGFPMSFATEASVDLAEDPELLQLMVDANIDEVFLGVESPSEEALRETKKIQNLADRGGTVLEKIHRVQSAGIEVWCGMIVGFDSDEAGIFEAQRRFIAESRIVQAMVNVLVAIPGTPLYKRLEREGRLVTGEWANFGTISTNVVPRKIAREALCDGYIELMRDIYAPEAFFGRLDALYLDLRLKPIFARMRYLSRFPLRKLRYLARLGLEGIAVFTMVMRGVPDPALRRIYRQRLLRAALRRPNPAVLRIYAIKCAMHYHAYRFVQEMRASRNLLPEALDHAPVEAVAARAAVG